MLSPSVFLKALYERVFERPKTLHSAFVLAMKVRWVPCALCGSTKFETIYEERWNFVRCPNCGLVMYNPQPDEKTLADFYNHEGGYLPSIRKDVGGRIENTAMFGAYDAVLWRLPKPEPGSAPKIVEVGCAYGLFLRRAREWGWDPFGIEISKETSAYARDVEGLTVETGTIFDTSFPDGAADCVVMMQVIEHVSDPVRLLKRIRQMLRPGGLLYLTTPNIESLAARIHKDQWEFKSFPNHLWYFSAATLEKALSLASLKLKEIGSHPGESTVGLDEDLLRQQLFLPPGEPIDPAVREFFERKLRGSELWAIAEAV